jgi:hypothetical protein
VDHGGSYFCFGHLPPIRDWPAAFGVTLVSGAKEPSSQGARSQEHWNVGEEM